MQLFSIIFAFFFLHLVTAVTVSANNPVDALELLAEVASGAVSHDIYNAKLPSAEETIARPVRASPKIGVFRAVAEISDLDPELGRRMKEYAVDRVKQRALKGPLNQALARAVAQARVKAGALDPAPARALAEALAERDPELARLVEQRSAVMERVRRVAGDALASSLERDPTLAAALVERNSDRDKDKLKSALVRASRRESVLAKILATAVAKRDPELVRNLAAALVQRDQSQALRSALAKLNPELKLSVEKAASLGTSIKVLQGAALSRIEGAALAKVIERDPLLALALAAALAERDPLLAHTLESLDHF